MEIRLLSHGNSSFESWTRPLALGAVGQKGPRKGFKGFKGLKEKKGGEDPPFFEGKKARPRGAGTPLCGGSVRDPDAR